LAKPVLPQVLLVKGVSMKLKLYTGTNMELVAIQVIIFGVIILVYMAQEFDK
jgi:hypothetical protein